MENKDSPLLNEVGEKKFLSLISKYVDCPIVDFNEDSSIIELPSGELLVINVDMLVQGTDVLPTMTPLQMGKKAVTMAISDVIAKGVKPLGCLASVGYPPNLSVKNAESIIKGIKEQCFLYDCKFLGGDLNEGKEIIIDVVAFGSCGKSNFIPRKGANTGDVIYSSGLFGLTSLGFEMLFNGMEIIENLKDQVLKAVMDPLARIEFLQYLQEFPIKICMDSSDGLFVTLNDLSSLNSLGINVTNVPIESKVKEFALETGLNPLNLVFQGGEEFELVFAISPELEEKAENTAKKMGIDIFKIGVFDEKLEGIIITDSRFEKYPFQRKGFEHFTKTF